MKMEMTEKDKKLLMFLSIFVIVVCIGYWGIYPVIKSTSNIKASIEDEEDIKSTNEFKLAELPLIQTDNADMEEKILDARKQFFPMMETDEIDEYITSMALDYKLFASDLNISVQENEASLQPYKNSKKALGDELIDEEVGLQSDVSDENVDAQSGEVIPVTTGIHIATVSLRVDGEKKQLLKLIDDLSVSESKLRLKSYGWGEERSIEYGKDSEDFEVVIKSVLSLEIELYMCEE